MRQFVDGYHRNANLGLAMRRADLRQDLCHTETAPFGFYDDASTSSS
jgi:hypothetical protein